MLKIDNFKANCWIYESSLFIERDIENFDFLTVICYALKKLCILFFSFFFSEMYRESLIKTNVTIIIKVWTFILIFQSNFKNW